MAAATARPSSSSVSSAKPYPRSESLRDPSFLGSGLGLSRTVDLSRAALSSRPRRRGGDVVACAAEKPRPGDASAASAAAAAAAEAVSVGDPAPPRTRNP